MLPYIAAPWIRHGLSAGCNQKCQHFIRFARFAAILGALALADWRTEAMWSRCRCMPALAASSCACIQWSSWLGHLEMARHIHPASFPWDLARKKLRKSSHFPSSEWRDFPNFQRSFGHLLSFFRGLDHAVLCLVGSHGHVPSSLGQQILVAFDQLRCRRGLVQQWDVLLGCITGYTSEIAILTRNSRKSTIKIWGPVVQYPFFRLLKFWTCKSGWWFGTFFIFPQYIYIWNVIIPTDFHIFQRVQTTNQEWLPVWVKRETSWKAHLCNAFPGCADNGCSEVLPRLHWCWSEYPPVN